MQKDLIYDIGMHTGKDAEFYLKKGFRVVAVEANRKLVDDVSKRLSGYIDDGRLTIVNAAIGNREGRTRFYINQQKDDWGTLSEDFVKRNEQLGTTHEVIEVDCIRLDTVLERCGIPYYIKIDIEGADLYCLEALQRFEQKPKFASIESSLTSFDDAFTELAHLWVLGYRQFKIVNQSLNGSVRCPSPAREGLYVDQLFDGHMSGPFGEEAPGEWIDIDTMLARYDLIIREQALYGGGGKYYNTRRASLWNWWRKIIGAEPTGWYDIHAKRPE